MGSQINLKCYRKFDVLSVMETYVPKVETVCLHWYRHLIKN